MRVIGIVTLLAICGAAPTTASGTLAELQAQREQLLEQIRVEEAKAEKADPLWKIARQRQENLPYQMAKHERAIEAAYAWAEEQWGKNPKPRALLEKSEAVYMLDAALRMLKEPQDAQLLKHAIFDPESNLKKKQLADQLVLEVPDLDRKQLDDPAKLWQAVSEKLPKSEKSIATDLAAMPKLLDAPPSVSEAIRLRDEHYLRNVVYGVYAQNRIPPAVERLYEQYAALYQQIEWATIRQKIDQKLGLEPPPTTPLK